MNNFFVFDEIIKGKLCPSKSANLKSNNIMDLVKSVNTNFVFNHIVQCDVPKALAGFNFYSMGYRSSNDFDFIVKESSIAGTVNISVFPTCVYELTDDIKLIQPPDEKSSLYLVCIFLLVCTFAHVYRGCANVQTFFQILEK